MTFESLPSLRLHMPVVQLPITGDVTLATVARLIASGAGNSKAELVTTTGLARTTVTSSVEKLARVGIVVSDGFKHHVGRGRPSESLVIAADAGALLIFDCGITATNLVVADMQMRVLARSTLDIDLNIGPETALSLMIETVEEMLAGLNIRHSSYCAIVGLPARIDYTLSAPVRPATMPLWDGFDVANPIRQAFGCDVLVENDANLRALGEARALDETQVPLLSVKVGTGIGAGLVTEDGAIHHGTAGASGEMGHITLRTAPPIKCRCGNVACLEAVASVAAMLYNYREKKSDNPSLPNTSADFIELLRARDTEAEAVVRESAGYLGEVIAHMVNIFNPARVVVTGGITTASDELLARIRAVVYEHARPLATRNLQISYSRLGPDAGIAGAVVLGTEHLLSPEALSNQLNRR